LPSIPKAPPADLFFDPFCIGMVHSVK
jgi:hypothetical protein